MGQEVKNLLRAQSKYVLMGSSAKQEKNFRGSLEHFLDKNAIWDRTPPQLHINCSLHVWGGSRVPNLQTEFNYLDLFKSYGIFSDFLVPVVPTLSPSSQCHPCCPHVIPVSSMSSPHHPHRPKKVPMWSPWLWSPWSPPHVVPIVPTSSPSSPHHPHCPNIIPIAPRRSPCGPHGCGLRGLHPMLSPWSVIPMSSPHHLEGPHIIPNHPDTHSTHPHPLEGWGPQISKNAIRFELIKIF